MSSADKDDLEKTKPRKVQVLHVPANTSDEEITKPTSVNLFFEEDVTEKKYWPTDYFKKYPGLLYVPNSTLPQSGIFDPNATQPIKAVTEDPQKTKPRRAIDFGIPRDIARKTLSADTRT